MEKKREITTTFEAEFKTKYELPPNETILFTQLSVNCENRNAYDPIGLHLETEVNYYLLSKNPEKFKYLFVLYLYKL